MSNTLGDRIKILRGSLTQRQFAEKIDIPATTLGNYEKNKSELNFATIDLFTKTFGINTDWHIGRTARKSLMEENRNLWKENGELREKCARLEERMDKPFISRSPTEMGNLA